VAPPPAPVSRAETAQPDEASAPAPEATAPADGDKPESLSQPGSSDPVSPADTAQPNAPTAPAGAGAAEPTKPGKPRSHSDPSHASPPPQKPKEDESAGVYGGEGTQQLPAGTAAYRVLVGQGGAIQSIALMRSSGVTSYDDAGVTMIRTSMAFDPPNRSGTVATIVTISFSAEGLAAGAIADANSFRSTKIGVREPGTPEDMAPAQSAAMPQGLAQCVR
jgi:outer membrane biosynthesis protein TonB